MKSPSKRIEEVYKRIHKLIMKCKSNPLANELEIKQLHFSIAEISFILDEIDSRIKKLEKKG